jgi:hypothetical protein
MKAPDCSKTPLTPAFQHAGSGKKPAKPAIRAGPAIRLMAEPERYWHLARVELSALPNRRH